MKKVLLVAAAIMVVAGVAGAAADVENTLHNLSAYASDTDEICVFCHTPHDARVVTTGPTNELPLWNKAASAETYTVYDSVTMDGSPAAFDGVDNISSALCMSCHDGTIGIHTLLNAPGTGNSPLTLVPGGNIDANGMLTSGSAYLASNLTNDHPVNFDYATAQGADTGLIAAVGGAVGGLPLYGGNLQCGTCHDPHEDTIDMFLRSTNAVSALCTTCHIK